jgi:hypothetical protein
MLAAEDESAFNQMGYHGDTLGALVNLIRDSLVGRRGEFVQRCRCVVQARLYFALALISARGHYRAKSKKH